MNDKENWIEETLNGEGIVGRAVPSDALMHRLKAIPGNVKSTIDIVPKKVVWAVAASIAILVCVNVIAMNSYEPNSETNVSQTGLDEDHFSYLKRI